MRAHTRGRSSGALLTRDWLLGVRRGWLSLLHPKIDGWDDVFAAFDRLKDFVDNLDDQIRYERPAPAFVVESFSMRRAAILDALNNLYDKLREERDRARTYHDWMHDSIPHPMAQYRADGARMLEKYRENFAAMLETGVPQRRNFKKGRYNATKMGHLTFYVDKLLELLRQEAATVARSAEVSPEETAKRFGGHASSFSIGDMRVVIDDTMVRTGMVRQYADVLMDTRQRLLDKRLGHLWHGLILVQCEDCGGINPYGESFGVGGDYNYATDVIRVYMRPSPLVIELVAHELGHRLWYKRANLDLRNEFARVVKVYDNVLCRDMNVKFDINTPFRVVAVALEQLTNLRNDVIANKAYRAVDAQKVAEMVGRMVLDRAFSRSALLGSSISNNRRVSNETFRKSPDVWAPIVDYYKTVGLGRDRAGDDALAKPMPLAFIQAFKEKAVGYLADISEEHRRSSMALRVQCELKYEGDERVPAVSMYGRQSIAEAFAEVFAYYVMERDLTRPQIDTFRRVLERSRRGRATGRTANLSR